MRAVNVLNRHATRVRSVFAVYAFLLNQRAGVDFDTAALLDGAFSLDGRSDGLAGLPPCQWEDVEPDYRRVVVKGLSNIDLIARRIGEYLDGWTFDRLPALTRAVMIVSYAETVLVEVTPKQVSINEAIEIVRQFGSPTETRYVNAVLERCLSAALGIESDYAGPGKVHIEVSDLLPDRDRIADVLEGRAQLVAPSREE